MCRDVGHHDRAPHSRQSRRLAQRGADAAVFGSLYLANPDLLQRFVAGAPLNAPERDTFFSDGPQGYIDYPVLEQIR